MRVLTRLGLFAALLLIVAPAHALDPTTPPNAFHPYGGGVNCIQVVDANGNFNCFATATINPTTGAVSIPGLIPTSGTFLSGVAIVPSTTSTTPQLLGSGDLVIATSPGTIAAAGPRIRGLTLRVRQGPAGTCQLVVAAGDGFREFVIPVLNPGAPGPSGWGVAIGQLIEYFPGGNLGC